MKKLLADNLKVLIFESRLLMGKAAADKVDISVRSSGGAKPLADGEAIRPITSGDLMKMFSHHAKAGSKDKAA